MPSPQDPTKREEWKRRLSESHLNQTPWNKGKKICPMAEETKLKISETRKKIMEKRGYLNTVETRKKVLGKVNIFQRRPR